VDKTDAAIYYSSVAGFRGGKISANKVPNKTRDNFFTSIGLTEALAGSMVFWGGYIKNSSLTEIMDNVTVFIDPNTEHPDDEVQIALEPNVVSGYRFEPYFVATGATYDETVDTPALDVFRFTISAWFKTTTLPSPEGMIANKGGIGDDTAGQNMNYGLWMTSTGTISAGFEDAAGVDKFVASPLTYHDGLWHWTAITYDSNTLRLYVDNSVTPVATLATTSTPEVNALPFRIGANSRALDRYFTGSIDEVRVWNRELESDELTDLFNDNSSSSSGKIIGKNFGANTHEMQTIATINTDPIGVEWSTAPTYLQGLHMGSLNPGAAYPFWLRRIINQTREEQKLNNFVVRIAFDPPAGTTGGGSGDGDGGGTPTPTPTPSAGDVDIAFDGDWGTSSGTKATVDNILSFPSVANTVVVGDISYESKGDKWASMTAKLRANGKKMYWNPGNHEYSDGSGLVAFYKQLFGTDKTYGSFTIGNILFVTGDMYIDFSSGSAQYNFIKKALEDAKNNSSILWKIVTYHEPLYGSSSNHKNNSKWRDTYHPLYDANGVDVAVNGHNHHYERTFPLKFNSGSPGSPSVVSKSQNPTYTSPGGTIFITCGLGGHDIQYKFKGGRNTWSAFGDDSTFGFLMISLSNGGKTLTGKLYKNSSHSLLDTWSITKA
jgi:hypothetical protein